MECATPAPDVHIADPTPIATTPWLTLGVCERTGAIFAASEGDTLYLCWYGIQDIFNVNTPPMGTRVRLHASRGHIGPGSPVTVEHRGPEMCSLRLATREGTRCVPVKTMFVPAADRFRITLEIETRTLVPAPAKPPTLLSKLLASVTSRW